MCPCANKTRGEEHFFTRQQDASAVRLFSSVFFFNVASMFFILCNILRSVNSRKAFKFLSKRLVAGCPIVWKSILVDEESRGWGIVSFCVPGGGE